MIIAKRLKGKAIATWLGPTGEAARRAVAGLRDKVNKAPRRLDLYVDIADPWSYLAAQVTDRLVRAYGVDIAVHVITPPASDVDPAPALRARHAVRDAQLLAEYWNVDFAGKKEADPVSLREVGTALVRERPAAEQLQAVLELTGAMWAGDKKQLALLLGKWGTESSMRVPPILNSNYEALRKAGHYQGGMLAYGGEWYWGVDRLGYLEEVLARDTGKPVAGVVEPRAERGAQKLSDKPLTCEMWFSFRSPYSYLALEQIESVLGDVPLTLRPVLPMVARGAQLPSVKRMYIVRDAKREADRLGIPFGEICDPLGTGVDNCIAIAHWANQRGALLPFAKSAMRGIWAEARDMAEYVDLKHVVERAGLPWAEAKEALGREEATKWATANAADLAVISLWGVPSFRCGDFVAWGQDRLPLLADRLRRHRLANPS
ncbi:MAG: DsbA family protein [Deltaproteobacteria bacterium]|nr:DsbA family protein [Deltaproteobacteria bacterium]